MPQLATPFSSAVCYQKTGSGPALVLIHGFPESGSMWRTVAATLAADFTVLVPDMPGSGGSKLDSFVSADDTLPVVSIAQMAEAVLAMLDAEKIDRAVVAGHSMGGYIALELARLCPDRIAGLSLVHSTPLPDDDEKKAARKKAIKVVRNRGRGPFVKQVIMGLFSEAFKQKEPETVELQVERAGSVTDEGLINFYAAMMARTDSTDVLKDASFPVQWIVGAQDEVFPYRKNLGHFHLAQVNFVEFYANSAHMSMFENSGQFTRDLTDFANYCPEKG